MADKLTPIIEELKKVGAMIPEKEWNDKCITGHAQMLGTAHRATSAAIELLLRSYVERNEINDTITAINILEGEGFLFPGTRDMLTAYLNDAKEAIKNNDNILAASKLKEYSDIVEEYLPNWTSSCACIKKGDFLERIAEGINVPSPMKISDTDKAATWTNIILKLSDGKIITPEEANDLISNWES